MGKRQPDRDQRSIVLTYPQLMSDPKRPILDDDAGLPWVRSPPGLGQGRNREGLGQLGRAAKNQLAIAIEPS
jgi:hypothetical protein